MIQQLPGRWSFLETLGAQFGKRNMNQQEADQQAQVEARQRAGNLAQLAQAGVLNPDILTAQQASDLNSSGLPSSSMMDWSKMVRDRRKAEQAQEQEKAKQTSAKTAAQIERIKAQTARDQAEATKLGQPVKPKAPTTTDLEAYTDTYVRAFGVRGATKMMDIDPQFSGWTPMQKGAWATAIGQKIAKGPPGEKQLSGPAALNYHQNLAQNAVDASMARLPRTEGEPEQAYRARILDDALSLVFTDPNTKDQFNKGLNQSHFFTAFAKANAKEKILEKRLSGKSGTGKYIQGAKDALDAANSSGNVSTPAQLPTSGTGREATQADVEAAVAAVKIADRSKPTPQERAAVEAELKKRGLTIPKG